MSGQDRSKRKESGEIVGEKGRGAGKCSRRNSKKGTGSDVYTSRRLDGAGGGKGVARARGRVREKEKREQRGWTCSPKVEALERTCVD